MGFPATLAIEVTIAATYKLLATDLAETKRSTISAQGIQVGKMSIGSSFAQHSAAISVSF